MRRRRLFNMAVGASLALLVAGTMVWLHSYWVIHYVSCYNVEKNGDAAAAARSTGRR